MWRKIGTIFVFSWRWHAGKACQRQGKRCVLILRLSGRRVARLEQRMGTPLFAKSPLGYELSASGARLLPLAEHAEQAMGAAGELYWGPQIPTETNLTAAFVLARPMAVPTFYCRRSARALCKIIPIWMCKSWLCHGL